MAKTAVVTGASSGNWRGAGEAADRHRVPGDRGGAQRERLDELADAARAEQVSEAESIRWSLTTSLT